MSSEAMVTCATCGTENRAGARFCDSCGAPLAELAAPRQARKVVTALFCDVTGSTALGEELDPEVLRGVLNRYFSEIRAIIERHGGTVEKFIGDAVMAVFGIPRVHEDDALRAVRAAAEIRERLPAVAEEVGVELRFRTGVNTGPVLTGEGENLAVGDAVNVAARLEQAAEPGEIVLGEETLALVRDAVQVKGLEPLKLKGKSEPVAAYRLVSVDPEAPGVARHMDVPLVGRVRELRMLREAWDGVVAESRCHLFTLMGTAGVGKSRLVSELVAGVDDGATVLRGRCLHYGEGITFWPLVEALMPLGEDAEGVIERLSGGTAAVPEELFWDVRRLLEALASERPVLLYVDDLQWAEPMMFDLLDHVSDLSRGAPILVLCTARPELLDDRPGWGGGKLNATTVLLEPLAASEAEAFLDELGDGLDPAARARVIDASEGNPLFLEEMVVLARERGTVEIPATIHALLAARLERLAVEERELLERGAVEGEVFHRLVVKALAGERLASEVERRLADLVRKELIRPHPATFKNDDAFRFRHLLIRDAAYETLPKATRAELHERFAGWLEQNARELLELDEIAGWHLEQAVRYRQDLGLQVEPRLPIRAAEHLHAAGTRAAIRRDLPATKNLLERALALTPSNDSLHPRVAYALAGSLVQGGDHASVAGLLEAAEADPEVAPAAALVRLEWMLWAHPDQFFERVETDLPAAIAAFEARDDLRGLARAHVVANNSHWMACRATAAAEELRLAAEYARAAGDEGTRVEALGWYSVALTVGETPAAELARVLDAIETEQPGPYLSSWVDHGRADLLALQGHFDQARVLMRRAVEQQGALGQMMLKGAMLQGYGRLELSAGNPSAARDVLLEADSLLAESNERSARSTVQAELARAYEQLGEPDRARAAIELAATLGVKEDVVNAILTHTVRALLALRNGDLAEAERWARSSVDYASRTDFVINQGEAKLVLARVLAAAGKREEAIAEMQGALALFERKGAEAHSASARTLLHEL